MPLTVTELPSGTVTSSVYSGSEEISKSDCGSSTFQTGLWNDGVSPAFESVTFAIAASPERI